MRQGNRRSRHLTRVIDSLPIALLMRLAILVFRATRLARRFFERARLAPADARVRNPLASVARRGGPRDRRVDLQCQRTGRRERLADSAATRRRGVSPQPQDAAAGGHVVRIDQALALRVSSRGGGRAGLLSAGARLGHCGPCGHAGAGRRRGTIGRGTDPAANARRDRRAASRALVGGPAAQGDGHAGRGNGPAASCRASRAVGGMAEKSRAIPR